VTANQMIRWTTVAAVLAIASVAAWVSYEHALAVVRAYGETGAVGYAYPATIDGMIYVSSMAMLDSARRGLHTPALARWMLGVGIAATLAVNVLAGLHSGGMGSVIAAWPALALVGAYELLMAMIRREAVPSAEEAGLDSATEVPTAPATVPETVADAVPADVPDAVPPVPEPVVRVVPTRTARRTSPGRAKAPEKVFAAELAAGELPSVRAIKERMHVGTDRARVIRADLESTMQEAAPVAAL
jgi:hypothetical protein